MIAGWGESVLKSRLVINEFDSGDRVKVFYKVKEGETTRIQPFEGIVLAIKNEGQSKTFTVRHIGPENIGVERIFPFKSPNLEKVELMSKGNSRRSKLYFLRKLSAKEVRQKLS